MFYEEYKYFKNKKREYSLFHMNNYHVINLKEIILILVFY